MAAAHEELKRLLTQGPGKAFVLDLTHRVYDWADRIPSDYIEYRVFEEFTVREATGQLTRKGLKKTDHYRFDAAIFVQPGRAALGQGQCFTVGLEIKGSKADLLGDKKILHYLGWLDFFLIAVPEELIDEALQKVEVLKNDDSTAETIGVMAIDTGLIYRLPMKQKTPVENRIKIYEQVIYNSIWGDIPASVRLKHIEVVYGCLHDPDGVPGQSINNQNNGLIKDSRPGDSISDKDMAGKNDETSALTEEDRSRMAKEQRREMVEQRAAENKARRGVLREKAAILSEDARQRLIALSPTAQEVFWHLRDVSPSGANGLSLRDGLDLSERTMTRAITELTREALVEREGSKKTGRYIVTELGRCDSCSGVCRKYSTCELKEK